MHHGKPVYDALCGGISPRRFKSQLKVVEDRKQFFEQARIGEPNGLLFLADHPLAVVFQIGSRPKGLITVFFHLGLEIRRDRSCLIAIGRRGGAGFFGGSGFFGILMWLVLFHG